MAIFRQNILQNLALSRQKFWVIFRQIAKVWAIPLSKFYFWHFLELWLILGTLSGSSVENSDVMKLKLMS